MSEDTQHLLVALGLGIPIAALATYVHFRVLRYLKGRKPPS
ncbi:MAG TPA: hypothetical protein VL403_12000 [Candidatus Kryptonia bacterium]|nr:hypothetical protein [Candidatus Kryptonia bacterium]